MQLWSSRHHHSGLVALSLTAEPGHPARPRQLPLRVRVVDAEIAAVVESIARADAAAARAAGRNVQIDLDRLVERASFLLADPEPGRQSQP